MALSGVGATGSALAPDRCGALQGEALGPDVPAGELDQALRAVLNLGIFETVLAIEADEGTELIAAPDHTRRHHR